MEAGVFAVARSIFEHDFFADQAFTEREAWIWLIGEAAWRPCRVRVGRARVALERGQCAYSTRFLAEKWGWSEAAVRRFLKRLKSDAMIDAVSDAHATVITIRNYNAYQRVSLPDDALDDALDDAEATHSRRKEEDREYTITNVMGAAAPVPDIRRELFGAGAESVMAQTGKTMARAKSLIGHWLKISFDDAAFVLTAIRQAEADRRADPVAWIEASILSRYDRRKPRAKTAREAFARG